MSTVWNPIVWGVDQMRAAGRHIGSSAGTLGHGDVSEAEVPEVRRIGIEDLGQVLRDGIADFAACRTDVMFLCVFYPIIGLVLAWMALDRDLLPLIFPVMSGFALIGPLAAVGLYEMSRRREAGIKTGWGDAFGVLASPSFGAIFVLGLGLAAMFLLWLIVAHQIWLVTLGPTPPESFGMLLDQVLTTGPGLLMAAIGMIVGFGFAVTVLAISVVSFPMLLDRPVGLPVAVVTSIRVARVNPGPIAAWGAIVALSLAAGSLPVFLGLVVVLPVLGHATWHLYRRTVVSPTAP